MAQNNFRDLEELLDDREKVFCKQLVINKGNATRAALKAGYAQSTAKSRAAEWIRPTRDRSHKPLLFDYYQHLLNNATDALDINIESVLTELKSIAMSNITDVVQLKGGLKMTIKNADDIPDSVKPAIAKITRSTYGITVQFHDKIEALKILLDYLNAASDQGKKGAVLIDKVEFVVKGSHSNLLSHNGKRSQKN